MASKEDVEHSHNINRFEGEVKPELLCSICGNVPMHPRLCQDEDHLFCFTHILQHLQNSQTCPICKQHLTPKTLKRPTRSLKNQLEDLKIDCEYKDRGCPDYVRLKNLQNHVEQCMFAPIMCENDGCGMKVNRRDKNSHVRNCQFRITKCDDCRDIKDTMVKYQDNIIQKINKAQARQDEVSGDVVRIKRDMDEVKGMLHQILEKYNVDNKGAKAFHPQLAATRGRGRPLSASIKSGQSLFTTQGRGRGQPLSTIRSPGIPPLATTKRNSDASSTKDMKEIVIGYDENRFESPVSKELICGICTDVLNDPKGCQNEHFFCFSCISSYFSKHMDKTTFCPVCKEPLTPHTLQDPPRMLIRLLGEQRICCDYRERGCQGVVFLGKLHSHVDGCGFAPVSCENEGCGMEINKQDQHRHETELCEFRDEKVDKLEKRLGTRVVEIVKNQFEANKQGTAPEERVLFNVATEAVTLWHRSNPQMPKQDVLVLGGRDQEGQSLTTAERFIFREGRWVEIPPMTTPRSFLSSVLVDNAIVVSGGDIGDAVTDSIETMNLDETPLQWITSPAKLPVPLSGHRTVVYEGRLIVIGGYDDNKGQNSDKIYEVSLSPPYTPRELCSLPQRKGWHGAELVNGRIFILGGGRNPGIPTNHVLIYDPVTNTCEDMPNLPYPVQGMATVHWRNQVILLGGMDENGEELDHAIMYDSRSGETKRLPTMNKRRGGCSAVITADILVALGGLSGVQNPNTVESYNFQSPTWKTMPPTREAREFGTAVVSPINFVFE